MLITAVWAQSRFRWDIVPSVGLWLSAILLALPVSWEHHLLFLLPVIAWLWASARETSARIAPALAAILMGVCWVPWYGDHGLGRWIACLPLAGNVLLFVLLIRDAFRPRKPSPLPVTI